MAKKNSDGGAVEKVDFVWENRLVFEIPYSYTIEEKYHENEDG